MIYTGNINFNSDYDAVEYVYYDGVENAFYDQCGMHITNIYDYVTPNDIYLFRKDNGNCCFTSRCDRRIIIEIITDDSDFVPYDEEILYVRQDVDWYNLVKMKGERV